MRKKKSNFAKYIKVLKENQKSFSLLLSKNSQTIIYNGNKIFFSQSEINPKIFHVSKKIKQDALEFLEQNLLFSTRKDRHGIRYYHYNNIPSELDRFYFIDISSCYVTILRNHNIISGKVFNEINSLKKKDRLISLGMLAYEPYSIKFIAGKQQTPERIINPYAPVFYYACNETMKLMEKIIKLIDGEFIFYWVDGIFFKDKKHFNLVFDYLKSKRYKFSYGACSKLISERKSNFFDLSFYQSSKNEFKKKVYSIPYYFADYEERKINHNLILEGNYDKLAERFKEQIKRKN